VYITGSQVGAAFGAHLYSQKVPDAVRPTAGLYQDTGMFKAPLSFHGVRIAALI